jgi:hypothetical protein
VELQNGQNMVGVVQPQQQIEQVYIDKVREQSNRVAEVGEVQIDPNLYRNISAESEALQRENISIATEQIKIDKIDQVMSSGGIEELRSLDSREASNYEIELQKELKKFEKEAEFITTLQGYRDEAKVTIDNSYKKIEETLKDISVKRNIDSDNLAVNNSMKEYKFILESSEPSTDKIYQSAILQQQLGVLLS